MASENLTLRELRHVDKITFINSDDRFYEPDGGMVRRSIGPLPPAPRINALAAAGGNGRRFQGLELAGRGQDAGQTRREQRLAAARRAEQQQVVPAGRRDFQRPARLQLPAHIAQVGNADRHRGGGHSRWQRAAFKGAADFQQSACDAYVGMLGQRRLFTVGRSHDQAPAIPGGCDRGRQDTVYTAQLAGEGQLAQEFVLVQGLRIDLATGGEDAERNGQIESAAFLGQIGGSQVDGDPPQPSTGS